MNPLRINHDLSDGEQARLNDAKSSILQVDG